MSTRLKQVLMITFGVVVAAVMIFLGLWQMQVFVDQGNRSVADRATQVVGPLEDHLGSDGEVGDIYGKQVQITGRYVPDQYVLVPTDDKYRVLAAFEVRDGRILPVVRGTSPDPAAIPPVPAGTVTETGLFLPGEGDAEKAAPEGMLGSVRMPLLAQEWPQQLVPGFVTLGATDAAKHGLAEAPVMLPHGEGSARNGGYALQWWVFAAFALGFAVKIAHGFGVQERRREEAALAASFDPHGKDDDA